MIQQAQIMIGDVRFAPESGQTGKRWVMGRRGPRNSRATDRRKIEV